MHREATQDNNNNTDESRKTVGQRTCPIAKVMTMVAAVGTLAFSGASIAQAASYTYLDGVSIGENQVRDSGNRANINGGSAELEPFAADGAQAVVFVETYRPAPGFTSLAFNSGSASVSVTHAAAANAHQHCWWDWTPSGGSIGDLAFTCRVLG